MENLKEMTIEALETMKKAVCEEIAIRQTATALVLYTHKCKNTAKHHLDKYKHWAKVVFGVDTTKTSGYAFQGDFLRVEAEHKLPVGSLVVEVCNRSVCAYRLSSAGKEKIAEGITTSMSLIIDALAKEV